MQAIWVYPVSTTNTRINLEYNSGESVTQATGYYIMWMEV